jgi:hypothetical protein
MGLHGERQGLIGFLAQTFEAYSQFFGNMLGGKATQFAAGHSGS